MKKAGKYFLILLSVIIACVIVVYIFLSPIATYIVEKNCEKWTGRKITVDKIKINLFKGSVFIKNLKIYEANGDSIFFNCHYIYLQTDFKKLYDGIYEVDKLKIDKPQIRITQNGDKFNFDDLVKHFEPAPGTKPDTSKSAAAHYYISNIIVDSANITYNNIPIHNIFRLHDMNFNIPQINWDNPRSNYHLDFIYGIGGRFNIDMDLNRNTLVYNLFMSIDKYDLSQYYRPLSTAIKISSLKGTLTSKVRVHGQFNKPGDFSVHGFMNISNIELRDLDKQKFIALKKLSLDVDSLDFGHNHFDVNHFILDQPYMVLNMSDKGSNLSRMMTHKPEPVVRDTATGKVKVDYSNIVTLLATSFKGMGLNFLRVNYHADSIIMNNGLFVYNDVTPGHKFQYKVSKINLYTNEIDDNNSGVLLSASANLGDSGKLAMDANLKYDFRHKLFSYDVKALQVTDISPVAKYLLERNSVKWTGRRITTGKIKLDAVKGSLFIKDIKIYEPDSTNVFFACHYVYMRLNLKKMLDNVYTVEKIKVDKPSINVIQDGEHFNFDDLVKRFSPKPDTENTPGVHYVIDSIIIQNANVAYNNLPLHNTFNLHELNFLLPRISWDNPETNMHLDFNFGTGGHFNADMDVNRNTTAYNVLLNLDKYDLSQYYAPLTNYMNISSLNGVLNSRLRLHGNFNSAKYYSAAGYIHLDDFEIKDADKKKVFAFGKLDVNIDTINTKENIHHLHDIVLDKPFLRFEYFTKGNNISNMIKYTSADSTATDTAGAVKTDYSNIFTLLSSSLSLMASNFVNSSYRIDSVVIRNGRMVYHDYTLNDPFRYYISDINIVTNTINTKTNNIQFNALATLKDTGRLKLYADIGLDLKNMLFRYDLSNVRVADFNPYSEYYIATSFMNGYMNYQSTDSIINRKLKSTNDIHIEGLKTAVSTDNKPIYKLPVHLALSLLKDDKGNLDIKIPASGNLDDPNYKLGPLIGHVLTDFIVKTAAAPFKSLAKLFKNRKPEDLKQFNFEYNDMLDDEQFSKLDDVCKILSKKKDLKVELTQVIDSVEEKDELALRMAKTQYYDSINHITNGSHLSKKQKETESDAVDKITTHDSLFNKYLDERLHLTGNELISVQDKCIRLLGDTMLSRVVHNEIVGRNQQIEDYLTHEKHLPAKRFKVDINKDKRKNWNTIEPEYDIKYTVEGS